MMHQDIDNLSVFRNDAVCYFLRQVKIFSSLGEHDLRDIADAAVLKTFPKGAYLFHKDDMVPGLYLVRRGVINFHRVAPDGREIVIHFYREGEAFAEFAAANEARCPADARAVLTSEVIIIPRRNFLTKLRQCPELALRLLASLDLQFHHFADSLEGSVSRNAASRFVQWLLRQCHGETSSEPVEICLGTTKRALASELGVRQETLSRTLRKLRNSGHLHVQDGRITITNPHALQAWTKASAMA